MLRQLSARTWLFAYISDMKIQGRLAFFAFGAFLFFWGDTELQHGHLAWGNWFGNSVFSPGIMAIGVFFAALSLIPPYRRSTRESAEVVKPNLKRFRSKPRPKAF